MAETAESSQETKDAPVAMTDGDFEVNAELMTNGDDDEATLEEEETLEAGEGFNEEELDDLHKDAEVPLADLIALYYPRNVERQDDEDEHSTNGDVPLHLIQPEPLPQLNQYEHSEITENGLDISPNGSPLPQDSPESPSASQSSVNPPENQRITRGLAAAYQYFPDSDSTSSDEDYSPTEDWKKEIKIGPEHQAEVPESTSPDSTEENEHASKCLWDPEGITDEELQKYLKVVCGPNGWDGDNLSLIGKGDDEQALYVLFQCNYNCDEAIKKFKSQPPPSEEMTFWSEEECRNFELGLRTCGKDFFSIQQTKIPDRTVGDIVQFYYLWKKTERHDAFSYQLRPNKKKYSFHPGITEYMDRFLDENESAASSSRPSSPHGTSTRPEIARSPLAGDDANHMILDKPPVSSHFTSNDSSISSGLLRLPQAYVPTPVIVTNDKEPPAKKPNLGQQEVHSFDNGPPPLLVASNSTIPDIPRLQPASHMLHMHNQLTTEMQHSEAIHPHLSYMPYNNRPTMISHSHSHRGIHPRDSNGSYAQLTQNS